MLKQNLLEQDLPLAFGRGWIGCRVVLEAKSIFFDRFLDCSQGEWQSAHELNVKAMLVSSFKRDSEHIDPIYLVLE